MSKFNFKLTTLSQKSITLIQIVIACIITLLFQFLIPFSWQPLDTFLYGVKKHGDPGTNLVIFTISQWYFSFSLAWFIDRDNLYVNNFLIYSIVPLGIIIIYEFFFLYFYFDYIHVFPVVIDIFLIWKKMETLSQKYALFIIPMNVIWLFSVYFLKLAYYNEDALIYIRNVLIYLILWILLSFLFRYNRRNG